MKKFLRMISILMMLVICISAVSCGGEGDDTTMNDPQVNVDPRTKVGDKITTDHIMPAGARLKFRSNVPEYAKYVFEPCDKSFHDNCMANREKNLANVIVAGESYGQGSSREHAALCPMYLGVKAVVAKSIERIHRANLINFGILPLIFVDGADYDGIELGASVRLDVTSVTAGGEAVLHIEGAGDVRVRNDLSEQEWEVLSKGGLLNAVRARRAC